MKKQKKRGVSQAPRILRILKLRPEHSWAIVALLLIAIGASLIYLAQSAESLPVIAEVVVWASAALLIIPSLASLFAVWVERKEKG